MNKHDGSTLDSLFEELGELEEVNARAAKKILAIEAERRMKKLGLSTTTLAQRMHTSRNQIHRILDEGDAGITLKCSSGWRARSGCRCRSGSGLPRRRDGDGDRSPRADEPGWASGPKHEPELQAEEAKKLVCRRPEL